MSGAYPNPFNPTTNITFSVARTGHVSLGVFDVQGHRVATIAEAVFAAGEHVVSWNALDSTGEQLASGTYLLRMVVGGNIRTTKLMLTK